MDIEDGDNTVPLIILDGDDEVEIADAQAPAVQEDLFAKVAEIKENGNTLFKSQEYKKAIDTYTAAIQLCTDPVMLAICYGNRSACYIKLLKYDDALRDVEFARSVDPNYKKYYIRVITCKYSMGDFSGAARYLNLAKASEPIEGELGEVVYRYKMIEALYDNVVEKYEAELWRDALFHIRVLFDECKPLERTRISMWRAQCHFNLRQFSAARDIISTLMSFDPNNVEAIFLRGRCHFYENMVEQSTKDFHALLILDPDHKSGKEMYKKTKLFRQIKEQATQSFSENLFEKAYGLYTKCLFVDPENHKANAVIYCNRATTLTKLNKHLEAIPDFNKAIELDQMYANCYHRRAKCYEELSKYEEAVKDFEKLCELDGSRANKALLNNSKIKLANSKKINYYKVLGVPKHATMEDIKKAYQRKAKDHHPDRHSGSSETEKKEQEVLFKQVGEAYATLGDRKKRTTYDLNGSVQPERDDYNSFDHFAFGGGGGYHFFYQQ